MLEAENYEEMLRDLSLKKNGEWGEALIKSIQSTSRILLDPPSCVGLCSPNTSHEMFCSCRSNHMLNQIKRHLRRLLEE